MSYTLQPMTRASAADIAHWAYADQYAVYSFTSDTDTMAELLGGDYYACTDAEGRLIGYFCIGPAARIRTAEGDAYAGECLDIGLGLRPALCGNGLGFAFMACGMRYFRAQYGSVPLRLTVAAFNRRAIALYKKHGFAVTASVTHSKSGQPFFIMCRP